MVFRRKSKLLIFWNVGSKYTKVTDFFVPQKFQPNEHFFPVTRENKSIEKFQLLIRWDKWIIIYNLEIEPVAEIAPEYSIAKCTGDVVLV